MSEPQEEAESAAGEAVMRISRAVERGDDTEANAGMLALMVEAIKNADQDDADSDLSLKNRARELEAAGAIVEAEAIHQKLLARFLENGPETQLFKAHHDYAWFLNRQSRLDEALRECELAVESARRDGMQPLIWLALYQQYSLNAKAEKLSEALESADEMVGIGGDERRYAGQKGRSLTYRADVRVRMNELDGAEADPVRARAVLVDAWSPFGGQSDLARCCELEAEVAFKRGNLASELASLEEAAECYRASPAFFFSMNSVVVERRRALFERLAECRQRAGDREGANRAREEGETSPILACALPDEGESAEE